MPWYAYLLQILAGALLMNAVPHLVHGISGDRFQTPFATPRGVGLSPPTVNFVWGAVNLAAGLALLWGFPPAGPAGWILVGAGAFVFGLAMSARFGRVRSDPSRRG